MGEKKGKEALLRTERRGGPKRRGGYTVIIKISLYATKRKGGSSRTRGDNPGCGGAYSGRHLDGNHARTFAEHHRKHVGTGACVAERKGSWDGKVRKKSHVRGWKAVGGR